MKKLRILSVVVSIVTYSYYYYSQKQRKIITKTQNNLNYFNKALDFKYLQDKKSSCLSSENLSTEIPKIVNRLTVLPLSKSPCLRNLFLTAQH